MTSKLPSLGSARVTWLEALYERYAHQGLKKEILRFVKFGLVGLSGVGVSLGSLWVLTDVLGFFYVGSAAFAHILAVTSNFTINQKWTFSDRPTDGRFRSLVWRWAKYLLSTTGTLGVNLGILTLFTEVLGVYYILSALCAIAISTPLNFLASTLWVWRMTGEKPPDRCLHGKPRGGVTGWH